MRYTYNFSAGPSVLPEPVLQEAADEMMNYKGSGMSVMEISHRSALFQSIIDEAEYDLRTLMNIPDDYEVLFLQGGTSLQFAMIPMNFMRNQKADYILTGHWSKKPVKKRRCMEKFMWPHRRRGTTFLIFLAATIWMFSRIRTMFICARTIRFMGQSFISGPTPRGKF